MSKNPELKSEITKLVDALSGAFTLNVSNTLVKNLVKEFYQRGLLEMELRFNMNFQADKDRMAVVQDFIAKNIQGMTDEMQDKIRKEITQGVLNLESITQIRDRIVAIADVTLERARMIARTEANRALNMAHIDAARQTGLTLEKEWVAASDERTCPICGYLHGERVKLDKKFVDKDGTMYDASPAHPNCRCRLIYVQV